MASPAKDGRTSLRREARMSVLVITTVSADVAVFEKVVSENAETMRGISDEARSRGAQRHLFADDGAGHVLIVDEWDSRESFDAFFGSQPDIGKMMAEVGVTAPPSTVSYRVLESADRF
jgi:heme-degrading monooxygenase HmoA